MKHARVTTNVLDLWAEPRYNSERKSQLLYGDLVTVGARRNGFARVVEADKYAGWVDERFLAKSTPIATKPPKGWQWALVSRAVINIPVAPHVIFYGTRLLVKSAGKGKILVRMIDGQTMQLPASLIQFATPATRTKVAKVLSDARKFLGSPYLWGGITVYGLDCSGMARAVYRLVGVYLPRDTKDQITVGTRVSRADIRAGDLLFFDRHVAISLGREKIIHSSRSGGGVRIQSLAKGDSDYRADLDRDFKLARRLL